MNFRTLIKLLALLAIAGALIWAAIIFIYKPIYSVTLNGEFLGYCEDKAEMQNRINEYMDNGSGENVAFVEINDLPEYKMCLSKSNRKRQKLLYILRDGSKWRRKVICKKS